MIWGTLQTEAYATVILGQVVALLGIPDDVPAGVAKRMARQQVLYDGEHHYDVVLGEQALYTNIGGPEVMREQMERLLRDIELPSLTLGIVPAAAEMHVLPMPGFDMFDGGRATYELVSPGADITDPAELALHHQARPKEQPPTAGPRTASPGRGLTAGSGPSRCAGPGSCPHKSA